MVFVVGQVVNLRHLLNKPRPCGQERGKTEKKILFTGTDPRRFRHLGEILHQPMIKIVPLDNYSPIAAYNVSGEYSMIKAAAQKTG